MTRIGLLIKAKLMHDCLNTSGVLTSCDFQDLRNGHQTCLLEVFDIYQAMAFLLTMLSLNQMQGKNHMLTLGVLGLMNVSFQLAGFVASDQRRSRESVAAERFCKGKV